MVMGERIGFTAIDGSRRAALFQRKLFYICRATTPEQRIRKCNFQTVNQGDSKEATVWHCILTPRSPTVRPVLIHVDF